LSRPTEAERILAVEPPVIFELLDNSGLTPVFLSSEGLGDGFLGGLPTPPKPGKTPRLPPILSVKIELLLKGTLNLS
jgi:hypothetical protein